MRKGLLPLALLTALYWQNVCMPYIGRPGAILASLRYSTINRSMALQAPLSAAPAETSWDQAGAFEAYWNHVKKYSSNVSSGTRSMYWDHVKATNGMPSGIHSKAVAQEPPYRGAIPLASALQQPLQQVQSLTQQQGQMSGMAASTQPKGASPAESNAPSELQLELAQRQSSCSSAQSQREKTAWSQQLPSVALPPLQAYAPEQAARAQSPACTAGAPLGALTAAQQLSAHDVFRRKWTPGGTLHVTWQEDPSFVPERMSSSATSLASYRSAARSMLSGAAVGVFPAAAGAQLPFSRQQLPAASMTAPSLPAASTYSPPSPAAATPASCAAQAPRAQVRPAKTTHHLSASRSPYDVGHLLCSDLAVACSTPQHPAQTPVLAELSVHT